MAKKQAVLNPTSAAGAAPARVAKAAAPRTRAGKHSKAALVEKAPETPVSAVEVEEFLMAPVEVTAVHVPVAENPIEVISRLAYGYWEARGGQGGDPLADWTRAEEEYRRLISA